MRYKSFSNRVLTGILLVFLVFAYVLVDTEAIQPMTDAYRFTSSLSPSVSISPESSSQTLSLVGHGWGPGVGMGQWGALGYALAGEPYTWILSHYYGGTSLSTLADYASTTVKVVISQNDGNAVEVTSSSPFSVAGISFSAGEVARITLMGNGSTASGSSDEWLIAKSASCSGSGGWQPVGSQSGYPDPVVEPTSLSLQASSTQVLSLCLPNGSAMLLRGELQAIAPNGIPETLNIVSLEAYLDGVVPKESPAYWGQLGSQGPDGQPWGFQELEAQAVAARSYVLADIQDSASGTICDTSACQVYGGMSAENPISNLAVSATAGQILKTSNGSIALAYYSSSTGGYTAGGPFPAVVDSGDSICTPDICNPFHTWHESLSYTQIQDAFPQIGEFESLVVTERNGLGSLGGRVEMMELLGSAGTIHITGSYFASKLGLYSNWFAVVDSPSGGIGGYWILSSNGSVFGFGDAPYYGSAFGILGTSTAVSIAPAFGGKGYWILSSNGSVFGFGDAPYYGSAFNVMNTGAMGAAQAVDMATTSTNGYWIAASDGTVFGFHNDLFGAGSTINSTEAPPTGFTPSTAAISSSLNGDGYLLVDQEGMVFTFGNAPQFGGMEDVNPSFNGQVTSIAVSSYT